MLVVVCFALGTPARAQQTEGTDLRPFQLAESYLRAGQIERGIRLLEEFYATNPDNIVVFQKLKDAYESIKQFDAAVQLVDARIQAGNRGVEMYVEKARLLQASGNEKAAEATWNAAIELGPKNRHIYRTVAISLRQARLFDRALEVLLRGRQVIGPDAGYELDIAQLYVQAGKPEEAMDEYLALVSRDENQFNLVRVQLQRLLEQEGATDLAIDATERAVAREPLNRPWRELLALLFTEAGRFDEALDAYRAMDKLERQNGRMLFSFARRATDAGAWEVAARTYKEIPSKPNASAGFADALFGLGDLYERQARLAGERGVDEAGERRLAPYFEQALDAYQRFADAYPGHPQFTEVMRRVGAIQRDVYVDLDAAERALTVVADGANRNAAVRDQAELDLGVIALMRDDLPGARLRFSRVAERLRTGELAARARLELADIHFYQGEFESALGLANALNENTSMDIANDAIALRVMLLENRGPDSLDAPLRGIARAHLLERRHKHRAAIAVLDTVIASFTGHPAVDDARLLRAEALRAAGRPAEAAAAFADIPVLHPDSYLSDRALFYLGDLLENDLGDTNAAMDTYGRILAEYPGSLYAAEARTRLRLLRGDGASA